MLNEKTEIMFTNISWSSYCQVMLVLLAGWYFFVGFRYYFTELKSIFTGQRFSTQVASIATEKPGYFNFERETTNETLSSAFADSDPTFQDVDNLVARLKTVVAAANQGKPDKDEFMGYLSMVLKEYPTVKNSPFQSSVSELIVSECEKSGSVILSPQEAEELWSN